MVPRTAALLNCSYAIHASTRIAIRCGLSKSEVAALLVESSVGGIDPDLVLISRMAGDIAERATLREDVLEAAVERWSVDSVRQMILMLGWFNLIHRYVTACRVPNDPDTKLECGERYDVGPEDSL